MCRFTSSVVANAKGIPVPVKTLLRGLKPGETRALTGRRMLLGHQFFTIGLLLPDGEYLILVTDKEPEGAIKDYMQRWEIETLFGCLKRRGFRFESTHMTKPERISKLVALLAIAFCWCHITAEWLHCQKPIKIKKHGRKAISIFRYGLDHLCELVLNTSHRIGEFKNTVLLLLEYLTPSTSHATCDIR